MSLARCPACGRYVTRGKRWCRLCIPTTTERRRQAGLCVRCGKAPGRAGAELCAVHHVRTRVRQIARNRRAPPTDKS